MSVAVVVPVREARRNWKRDRRDVSREILLVDSAGSWEC